MIQLFDFQGNMLQNEIVVTEAYSIDMTKYKSGIYLVRIISPVKSIVRKIVKE